MKSLFGTTALSLLLSFGFCVPVLAANYALVIGIDEYETQPDLGGAVNDAKLIARALSEFGVKDMRVLLDGDASYDALRSAWTEIVEKAQPGDTIILTYSGHGARLPDENGDEASASQPDDVTDEMLVLGGFDTQSEAALREKIVDDELHLWFLEAGEKGVQVVFLADSCFSGTVTRGGRARFLEGLMGVEEQADRKPVPLIAETEEETIDNVVFLAGSREAEPVIEVAIDGRYHGALSYSFARALSMDADLNDDGILGRDDLKHFIPRTAQSVNGSRHLPEINPSRGPDFPVLVPDSEYASAAGEIWPEGEGEGLTGAGADLNKFPLSNAPGTYWDRLTGNIHDPTGEIVGYNVDESYLEEVNDKFAILKLVREGMIRNGFEIDLLVDGEKWHREVREGQGVVISIGPLEKRYLTVFNLANNGEVQLLYPIDNEERGPASLGYVFKIDTIASPPFGSDELVAVVSDSEPTDLRQALKWALPANDFTPILNGLLARGGAAFGHVSLHTQGN